MNDPCSLRPWCVTPSALDVWGLQAVQKIFGEHQYGTRMLHVQLQQMKANLCWSGGQEVASLSPLCEDRVLGLECRFVTTTSLLGRRMFPSQHHLQQLITL
jgi:hypothetical protein